MGKIKPTSAVLQQNPVIVKKCSGQQRDVLSVAPEPGFQNRCAEKSIVLKKVMLSPFVTSFCNLLPFP